MHDPAMLNTHRNPLQVPRSLPAYQNSPSNSGRGLIQGAHLTDRPPPPLPTTATIPMKVAQSGIGASTAGQYLQMDGSCKAIYHLHVFIYAVKV